MREESKVSLVHLASRYSYTTIFILVKTTHFKLMKMNKCNYQGFIRFTLFFAQGLPGPTGAPGEPGKPGDQVRIKFLLLFSICAVVRDFNYSDYTELLSCSSSL